MREYNVIAVFNYTADKVLFCRRKKEPYKGLSNLVGGKIEPGEAGLDAAYRELEEETAIGRGDIVLSHLMDFTYHISRCRVEVYAGRLQRPLCVAGDENELYWSGLDRDFFDASQYAGEGNIGHIIAQIRLHQAQLLG